MKPLRDWRTCIVCVLLALAMAAPARAQDELKLSVATGPAMTLGSAAQRWAALMAERDASLVVRLHPGAALAKRDPAREFLALRQGEADLAVGSALQWSMQVPSLGVFSLPWVAPRDSDLAALAADRDLTAALAARMEVAGVVLVAIAPLGYREIATVARPIRGPDDMKGLRLRATPLPMLHDLLLALGALPQAMSFRDAQAAFAANALDGQEAPPTVFAASRAGAIGPRHLSDWGGIADAIVFAVRGSVWQRWTERQREDVRRAAQQAIVETRALEREAAAVKTLAGQGVSIVRITPAGHEAFRVAAAGVTRRWRQAIGEDVVVLAERAVGAQGTPR